MYNEYLAAIQSQLQQLLSLYRENYAAIYEAKRKAVALWRYGRGGTTIHRGWFCPSPIKDIVVGNASRGKLLKNAPQQGKPADYVYGFSANDELLTIDGPYSKMYQGPARREVVIQDGFPKIGLQFDEWHGKTALCGLSICVYKDGRIVEYITTLRPNVQSRTISTFECERYRYGPNGELVAAKWIEWTNLDDMEEPANDVSVKSPLIRERTYGFEYDAKGSIAHYTVDQDSER